MGIISVIHFKLKTVNTVGRKHSPSFFSLKKVNSAFFAIQVQGEIILKLNQRKSLWGIWLINEIQMECLTKVK